MQYLENRKADLFRSAFFESGRRDSNPRPSAWKANALSTELLPQFGIFTDSWAKMDSNHRRRKPADLQSAPFGHSGIRPKRYLSNAMQRYDYFRNFQTKSTIFIAVIAHSVPLLPFMPPALSNACCISSVVKSPKMNGISYSAFNLAKPLVVP